MHSQICIKFFESSLTLSELCTNFFEHHVHGFTEVIAVFQWQAKHACNDVHRNVLCILHCCINRFNVAHVVDEFIAQAANFWLPFGNYLRAKCWKQKTTRVCVKRWVGCNWRCTTNWCHRDPLISRWLVGQHGTFGRKMIGVTCNC